MSCDYSIVVPVYKTVETLSPLFEAVRTVMDTHDSSFEVIYIEDSGSHDTWKELLRLKENHKELVTIVRLSKNFGQNSATLCGITIAKGDKLITIDDDLQVHPTEISKLISRQKETGAAVVYGAIPKQKTSWIRRVGSSTFKRIFNRNTGPNSIGSSFRLIDAHVYERLRDHSQNHLFINQVITWYTASIESAEIEHSERQEGKSGYSLIRLSILSIRLLLYYTSLPLKFMIGLSFAAALGIIGLTGYYIFYQVKHGQQFDLFMIAVLVAMGVISASIGVFGVYINRIYSSRVSRPTYAIKAKL